MGSLALKIGQNISNIRKKQGVAQEQLALIAGLDRSYMGRIERGEGNVTVKVIYGLAEALSCDISELLPKRI